MAISIRTCETFGMSESGHFFFQTETSSFVRAEAAEALLCKVKKETNALVLHRTGFIWHTYSANYISYINMNRQSQYFWTSAHLSGKFHIASWQTKAPTSFAIEWSWTITQSAPANQTNQVSQRISRTAVSSTWDGSPAAKMLLKSPFPSHENSWEFMRHFEPGKIEKNIKFETIRGK